MPAAAPGAGAADDVLSPTSSTLAQRARLRDCRQLRAARARAWRTCTVWVLQVVGLAVSDPRHWRLNLNSLRGREALYRSRTLFVQRRMCPASSRDDPLGPVSVSDPRQPQDGADFTELCSLATAEPHIAAFAQACLVLRIDPVVTCEHRPAALPPDPCVNELRAAASDAAGGRRGL